MATCRPGAAQVVTDATAAYLEAEDALAAWIDDCCERDPRLGRVIKSIRELVSLGHQGRDTVGLKGAFRNGLKRAGSCLAPEGWSRFYWPSIRPVY